MCVVRMTIDCLKMIAFSFQLSPHKRTRNDNIIETNSRSRRYHSQCCPVVVDAANRVVVWVYELLHVMHNKNNHVAFLYCRYIALRLFDEGSMVAISTTHTQITAHENKHATVRTNNSFQLCLFSVGCCCIVGCGGQPSELATRQLLVPVKVHHTSAIAKERGKAT